MGFNYDKLWKLLIDKKMSKGDLQEKAGISSTTLARMGKEENVSLRVLAKLCDELNCDVSDIISYKRNKI